MEHLMRKYRGYNELLDKNIEQSGSKFKINWNTMGLKTSIEQEKVVFAYMLKRPQYLLHVEKDFSVMMIFNMSQVVLNNSLKNIKKHLLVSK